MGKIMSGILSGVSGKVAGVVGARWKDKYYLRAHVKPANPNTDAQQAQRSQFSRTVEFAKPLVGQVFNAYTDKFIKNMSGFNFFIKRNIDQFIIETDWSTLKITEGPLSPVTPVTCIYSTATVEISFGLNFGNNGAATDKVFAAVYNSDTKVWSFSAAEVPREDEFIEVVVGAGLNVANLEAYCWPSKYIGTVLDIIGNSIWQDVTTS